MYKISATILSLFFVLSVLSIGSSVNADICTAPVTMSCTYGDNGDDTIDATVLVNYAVDGATALDGTSVVFSGDCDATAVGVGVEAIDPTHDTTPVSNGDGDCNEAGDANGICTAGDTSITACAANADCDTFSVDTNPCGEGDMKIKAADFATFCTVNTTSNADGVCVHDGDPDGTCTAGDTSITMCMADSDCDTFSASSIDCTKLIEDIDVSACDMEIGVIAESSNLHDPSNESDTNDCNGKKCKKDGDDKGHDRGKVLCTEVM